VISKVVQAGRIEAITIAIIMRCSPDKCILTYSIVSIDARRGFDLLRESSEKETRPMRTAITDAHKAHPSAEHLHESQRKRNTCARPM
jgi:hypothetical protein